MRTIFMALSLVVVTIMAVNAQSGVYLSLNDFENNRLSYATNAESDDNKLRFNEFLHKPHFRSDADLARYDNFANKYKVNHLLEKTSTAISKR